MSDATRRQTRSQTRREHRTLLAQALAVCMTGGYLYRYECMKVACLSHGCHDLYQDCQDNFPAGAEVFIHVGYASFWASDQTKALFTSPAVLRTIFDKINHLHVQSQATPKKCAAAKAALPLWGVDAQRAVILGFEWSGVGVPMVMLRFTRSQFPHEQEMSGHTVWRCILRYDFTLVQPSSSHQIPAIRDYYDGEPLWP
jgi:hypothetical protein